MNEDRIKIFYYNCSLACLVQRFRMLYDFDLNEAIDVYDFIT